MIVDRYTDTILDDYGGYETLKQTILSTVNCIITIKANCQRNPVLPSNFCRLFHTLLPV